MRAKYWTAFPSWRKRMVLDRWIDTPVPEDHPYWVDVRRRAFLLRSDGCTGVRDVYRDSCLEHDLHWRTGYTLHGLPITTIQANRRFRKVIQSRSPFGRWSPLAWWRWVGVTIGSLFLDHKSA